jgi:hypothetical protein
MHPRAARPVVTGIETDCSNRTSLSFANEFLKDYRGSQTLKWALVWLILISGSFASGCVRNHYQYGLGKQFEPNTSEHPNPITTGGEHPRLDRMERVVQYPIKAFKKWFRDPKKPEDDPAVLQEQTLRIAQQYLTKNELQDVYIDIRQYDPKTQWARTKANPRISPFWKYTGGALNVATYSIFPGRVFHFDSYDPFSNTLSINSSNPNSSLYQAGLSKDYRSRYFQGTYAVLQKAPFVPIVQNANVTSDVLTYARVHDLWELEKELYPTAYANLASSIVSEGFLFVPRSIGLPFYTSPIASLAAGVVGGASGMVVAKQQEPYVLMARERNKTEGVSSLFR